MHSTHCRSIQGFVFHTSALKFSERLHLHRPYEWQASLQEVLSDSLEAVSVSIP